MSNILNRAKALAAERGYTPQSIQYIPQVNLAYEELLKKPIKTSREGYKSPKKRYRSKSPIKRYRSKSPKRQRTKSPIRRR
jgi:hypothetical protein